MQKVFVQEYVMSLFTAKSVVSITKTRKPDFTEISRVFDCKKPTRPTLFEFYTNPTIEDHILEAADITNDDPIQRTVLAFRFTGYDYATVHASDFSLKSQEREKQLTASYSAPGAIKDWESYEAFRWADPGDYPMNRLSRAKQVLPEGMKLMICGPGGVLENVIELCGYENLCFMLFDDRELVKQVCDDVGSRMLKYYQMVCEDDDVGIIMTNDDWGFNKQTMISAEDLRTFIFPWHKKIAAAAHEYEKKVALHSCGQAEMIYEDIITDIKIDGKHSYEDKIEPVEDAYKKLKGRLAVLGGIDVDFMCRSEPQEVFDRAKSLLNLTKNDGGYALGTGNSVPTYVPAENYYALLHAAFDE